MPAGYRHLRRSRTLRRRDFDAAVGELFDWQVQRRAGLRVPAQTPPAAPDVEVVARFGPARVPCRVIYVVDEPDVRGFAYGTLPGHPERGEEQFLLTRASDGAVTFTITAFSRPDSLLARAGGPLGRLVQDAITAQYLRALDRPAG